MTVSYKTRVRARAVHAHTARSLAYAILQNCGQYYLGSAADREAYLAKVRKVTARLPETDRAKILSAAEREWSDEAALYVKLASAGI